MSTACAQCYHSNKCGLAKLRGMADKLDDKSRRLNPYQPRSGEHQSWDLGWQDQDHELGLINQLTEIRHQFNVLRRLVGPDRTNIEIWTAAWGRLVKLTEAIR